MPNVAVIIGEGGSGGAIAIATANRVLMLEHAIYSVISPEGAASILWRDTAKAQEAATNMKITAQDLLRFGVIDTIVPEPIGGAHRDPAAAIAAAGEAIGAALAELQGLDRGDDRAAAAREVHGDRARCSTIGAALPKSLATIDRPRRRRRSHRWQIRGKFTFLSAPPCSTRVPAGLSPCESHLLRITIGLRWHGDRSISRGVLH